MQTTHEPGDGKFAPGFARTVTTDDPVALERVLALAAVDADAEAIIAAMLVEAEKAKTSDLGGVHADVGGLSLLTVRENPAPTTEGRWGRTKAVRPAGRASAPSTLSGP